MITMQEAREKQTRWASVVERLRKSKAAIKADSLIELHPGLSTLELDEMRDRGLIIRVPPGSYTVIQPSKTR